MGTEDQLFIVMGVDLIPFLPSMFSILFIIIGWGVIYHNAKKLSSRTEAHAFANNIVAILKDIEILSEEFWFKSVYNSSPVSYEMLVISKIKIIRKKLNDFSDKRVKINNLDDLIFKLRKACTSQSSTISTLTQAEKRSNMNQIINSISVLELSVSDAISKKYPHT